MNQPRMRGYASRGRMPLWLVLAIVAPLGLVQGLASLRQDQMRAAAGLPLAVAGATLHASRRTPRMSWSGEATKIDE